MLTQSNQIQPQPYNKYLLGTQRNRVIKLHSIYLQAMKIAFDEGNRYVKQTMTNGDKDLVSALRIRSYHIDKVAKKYEEYNIKSLAQFFNVSPVEIRNATNSINNM